MLIHDLSLSELTDLMTSWGESAYRARQIWRGLYQNFWCSPAESTDLPAPLRDRLAADMNFAPVTLVGSVDSGDRRTRKMLFELRDRHMIETVLMRYDPDTFSGRGRRTLCISTQAGCAMGCVFCATGQMGFKRNLSSGEIVGQVMHAARLLQGKGHSLTNIVFMGMGEPFHNYENTMAATDRLSDPLGYNFGARRMTISTVGLVPQIRRFADEHRQVNLAVSLHAADDEARLKMLPVNKHYNIAEVLSACRYYVAETGRRITFEWALIEGVNDSPKAAMQLASRLRGLLCHVNAIPLNPTAKYAGRSSSRERAARFKAALEAAGIPCTVRLRRGVDIHAGCGQLAALGVPVLLT